MDFTLATHVNPQERINASAYVDTSPVCIEGDACTSLQM